MTIVKVSAADAGCWVEGSRGWRATSRVVEIAHECGMSHSADDDAILAAFNNGEESVTISIGILSYLTEDVVDMADQAEAWLNENVAPEGFSFGWSDGEFFLWSNETWEEES